MTGPTGQRDGSHLAGPTGQQVGPHVSVVGPTCQYGGSLIERPRVSGMGPALRVPLVNKLVYMSVGWVPLVGMADPAGQQTRGLTHGHVT